MSPGKGTQVWKKSGAVYEGDWKFGKRDGYGSLSHPDPETGKLRRVYSGWWKGDKKSVEILDPDGVLKEALDKLMKPEEEEG